MSDTAPGVSDTALSIAVGLQAKLDTLDVGSRKVSPKWHDWGNVDEGGATKPSIALA